MSRYIDADELLKNLPEDLPYKASVKRVLMQAPTADAVEVVRCKDCKRYSFTNKGHCDYYMGLDCAKENDFCSYAERRAEE